MRSLRRKAVRAFLRGYIRHVAALPPEIRNAPETRAVWTVITHALAWDDDAIDNIIRAGS